MRLTFGEDWSATVAGDSLHVTPRFDFAGQRVRLGEYRDVAEHERLLVDTFGSRDLLWDTPDELRFDRSERQLAAAQLQLPGESAPAEDCVRVPVTPAVRPGGLRADEARDFRLEATTVLCRTPEDTVLTCLRDLDVLDKPVEARIGIAPDVALLVQGGAFVGWSLTDPARYLTTGFTAPDSATPSQATRQLFAECLELATTPVFDDVFDREPAALNRLRAVDLALRHQREDRHRADALLALISNLVEDYADPPTEQKP
ncbi:hypothetical protein ACFXCZ_05610 [Streptomyces sp. NPDC059396]|uniref:hypothetical protein n=1 Tax=Streptomyces sp. NPDC059396 TaxID=3346819 RepID=UPI0036CAE81A